MSTTRAFGKAFQFRTPNWRTALDRRFQKRLANRTYRHAINQAVRTGGDVPVIRPFSDRDVC